MGIKKLVRKPIRFGGFCEGCWFFGNTLHDCPRSGEDFSLACMGTPSTGDYIWVLEDV